MAKLLRSIAIQLQSFQPAVSEHLLQPEELRLRQRMRGLEKLQGPYRPELTVYLWYGREGAEPQPNPGCPIFQR